MNHGRIVVSGQVGTDIERRVRENAARGFVEVSRVVCDNYNFCWDRNVGLQDRPHGGVKKLVVVMRKVGA